MTAPLPLYRALMRQAKHLNDYNFRMYAIRRVKAGFVKNRTSTSKAWSTTDLTERRSLSSSCPSEEAAAAFKDGQEQLEVLRRQAVLGSLYPSARSVMES